MKSLRPHRLDLQKCKELWIAATEGNLAAVQTLCRNPSVNINWQDEEANRTPFYRACYFWRTETVRFMLGLEDLQVNLQQQEGATPFNIACFDGRVDVVLLLLADKRVDVNIPLTDGVTPFYVACQNGHLEVISLLLADERVNVNKLTNDNTSPLWIASSNGHLDVVQHLLASDRDVDTKAVSAWNHRTARDTAAYFAMRKVKAGDESDQDLQRVKDNGPLIASLIDSYQSDPRKVRAQLRRELYGPLAGELFALVVFLSDGYLKVRSLPSWCSSRTDKSLQAQRFLALATQLPMDLQMALCNRVFNLGDSIVKRVYSENGFQKFAKGF